MSKCSQTAHSTVVLARATHFDLQPTKKEREGKIQVKKKKIQVKKKKNPSEKEEKLGEQEEKPCEKPQEKPQRKRTKTK